MSRIISKNTKKEVDEIVKAHTGQANNLVINTEVLKFCNGSYEAAALLSQLIYWNDRTSNKEGWIAKTYNEWEEEISVNEYGVRKAVKLLVKIAGAETKLMKFRGSPTVHYRIRLDVFYNSFLQFLKNRTFKIQRIEPVKSEDSLYTETTTETITEREKADAQISQVSIKDNYPTKEVAKTNDSDVLTQQAIDWVNHLAKITNKESKGINDPFLKEVKQRIKEYGYDEMIQMAEYKTKEWIDVDHMKKHLKPQTLSKKDKVDGYMEDMENEKPAPKKEQPAGERKLTRAEQWDLMQKGIVL